MDPPPHHQYHPHPHSHSDPLPGPAPSGFGPIQDVFVGHLPLNTTDSQLRGLFSPFGQIRYIKLFPPKPNGAGGGGAGKGMYAFIQFTDQRMAGRAIRSLDGYQVQNCVLRVKWSLTKGKENQYHANGPSFPPQNNYGGGGGGGGGYYHRKWQCMDPMCGAWLEPSVTQCPRCKFVRPADPSGVANYAPMRHQQTFRGGQNVAPYPNNHFPHQPYKPKIHDPNALNIVSAGAGRGTRRKKLAEIPVEQPGHPDENGATALKNMEDTMQSYRQRCKVLEKQIQMSHAADIDLNLDKVQKLRREALTRRKEMSEVKRSDSLKSFVTTLKETTLPDEAAYHEQFKLAKKGQEFYRSMNTSAASCTTATDEEGTPDDTMETVRNGARNGAAKELAKPVKKYLELFPKSEIEEKLTKTNGAVKGLCNSYPFLKELRPKCLDPKEFDALALEFESIPDLHDKSDNKYAQKSDQAFQNFISAFKTAQDMLLSCEFEEDESAATTFPSLGQLSLEAKSCLEKELKKSRNANHDLIDHPQLESLAGALKHGQEQLRKHLEEYNEMLNLGRSLQKDHECEEPIVDLEMKLSELLVEEKDCMTPGAGSIDKDFASGSSDDLSDIVIVEEEGEEKEGDGEEDKLKVGEKEAAKANDVHVTGKEKEEENYSNVSNGHDAGVVEEKEGTK